MFSDCWSRTNNCCFSISHCYLIFELSLWFHLNIFLLFILFTHFSFKNLYFTVKSQLWEFLGFDLYTYLIFFIELIEFQFVSFWTCWQRYCLLWCWISKFYFSFVISSFSLLIAKYIFSNLILKYTCFLLNLKLFLRNFICTSIFFNKLPSEKISLQFHSAVLFSNLQHTV